MLGSAREREYLRDARTYLGLDGARRALGPTNPMQQVCTCLLRSANQYRSPRGANVPPGGRKGTSCDLARVKPGKELSDWPIFNKNSQKVVDITNDAGVNKHIYN
jgi:hypothetical protein